MIIIYNLLLLMLLDKMGKCIRNPIQNERIDNEEYIRQNFELIDHPERTYKDLQQNTNSYQDTKIQSKPMGQNSYGQMQPQPMGQNSYGQMQPQPMGQNSYGQMQPQPMGQNSYGQMQPQPMGQNTYGQMQPQPMGQNTYGQMQPQPIGQNSYGQMQPQPMGQNTYGQMQPQPMGQNPNGQMQPQPMGQNPNGQMQPQPMGQNPNGQIVEAPIQLEQEKKIKDDKKEIIEICSVGFDSLLYDDPSIKYIALDLTNHMFINFSNEDKEEIIKYFSDYGLEVINNSLPSLKILGRTDENNGIEGILLTLTNFIFMREDTVIIEGYRYQNQEKVVGFRNQVCKENDKWVLKDRKKLWD